MATGSPKPRRVASVSAASTPDMPDTPLRSALLAASRMGAVQCFLSHLAKSASCPTTPSLQCNVIQIVHDPASCCKLQYFQALVSLQGCSGKTCRRKDRTCQSKLNTVDAKVDAMIDVMSGHACGPKGQQGSKQ